MTRCHLCDFYRCSLKRTPMSEHLRLCQEWRRHYDARHRNVFIRALIKDLQTRKEGRAAMGLTVEVWKQ